MGTRPIRTGLNTALVTAVVLPFVLAMASCAAPRDGVPHAESTGPMRGELLVEYFDRLAGFGIAGSYLAGSAGETVAAGGIGLADREAGRAFTPSTVVTIGSITKPFTAAAVLELRERGALDVADSIGAYLEGVPRDRQGITIHHLLTHTSGLKRNGLEGGDFTLEATREAVLRQAYESDLLAAPGERFSYSNLGYSLLAMIVEEAAGVPYERFVHRELLAPTGMESTGYLIPDYRDDQLAAGYRGDRRLDPVIRQPMLPDGPTWNLRGNGGFHSTAAEMHRWYRALRSGEVLSPGSVDLMTWPHVTTGDGDRSYGYGWYVETTPGGTRDISHSGGNGYFAADFHWLPDDDLAFFFATNEAADVNVRRLWGDVRAILLGGDVVMPPRVVPVATSVLAAWEGAYAHAGDTIRVAAADSSLTLTAAGDGAIRTVLGGDTAAANEDVQQRAARSRHLVEREFAGDFRPKFEAMGGTVSIESLARYHGYDREIWDAEFGTLEAVETVAATAERDEVIVIVRIVFERGAAAQVHTWRGERLANISVIPDWTDFNLTRTVYPLSASRFESFDIGSDVRLVVERRDNRLVFPRRTEGGVWTPLPVAGVR